VAAVALAVSLGSWLHIGRSTRLAEAARVQAILVEAYQGRAFGCLDTAVAALRDPALLDRAEKSLDIARGITLCLVKGRDGALLRIDEADACVKDVEARNTVLDAGPAETVVARPAC
jgi:hypothetical protein